MFSLDHLNACKLDEPNLGEIILMYISDW
jgi:hypothetical protein